MRSQALPITYAKAGVDIKEVRKIQNSLGAQLGATFASRQGKVGEPILPIGHYGGVINIGSGNALTLHTDGVGSKVLVAQELGRFDTIGIDCVAMTVNDLICLGSEPIALLDYIALQKEDASLVEELGKGLVEGASEASAAIVGGETAVMGDVIKGKGGRGFDIAAMGVGIVKTSEIVDGSAIEAGDSVLGVASSGLHSNGYTLARKALRHLPLNRRAGDLQSTLGDSLLTPTSIYVKPTLAALKKVEVHGIAHITGGSFTKLPRLVRGRKLMYEIEIPPPSGLFKLLMREGGIPEREMVKTFNMGVGLCICLPERDVGRTARIYKASGFKTYYLGRIKMGTGVRVNGMSIA